MGKEAGYLYWKMYRKLSREEKELLKFEKNLRTEQVLQGCQCDINMFIPIGKKGEKYKILFDPSCIRWEPTMISIF